MEWLIEAVDQEARPMSPTANGMQDRLDALVGAAGRAELAPPKAATLRSILQNVRESIDNALKLLDDASYEPKTTPAGLGNENVATTWNVQAIVAPASEAPRAQEGDRVVEGVFDGTGMIGDDGKSYVVPPNYASKSKLVEGDMLKLTIGARGNFIYKQIGPIDRQRLIGTLAYEQEAGQFLAVAGGRSWKVLKASVTYFKADAGDEAVILVPKNAPSKWAAVENIIRKTPQI